METTNKKGFTLIELLIVIAIIGILAVAFLPSLLGAPAKGRDAQRMTSVQKIENFLVTELLANHELPETACISPSGADGSVGDLIADNLSDFGGVFPKDPQSDNGEDSGTAPECTGQYGYINFEANDDYSVAVFAVLEIRENANIACADIEDGSIELLTGAVTGSGGALPADADPCFVALVQ